MVIHIENFSGQGWLYAVARSEEARQQLRLRCLNVMIVREGKCYLEPENLDIPVSTGEWDKLSKLADEDVLAFGSARKSAYVMYSHESNDNAIMITARCNSNCIMCPVSEFQRKTDGMINESDLMEYARYLPEDAEHITITGGEPFLSGKGIFGFLAELRVLHPHTEFLVLTNGRIMADSVYADLFAATCPERTIVGIPIHGYNAQSHDSVTQTEGSFDQTALGIKRLLNRGIKVEIRFVVSDLNAQWMSKMAQLIIEEFPSVLGVKMMGLEMTGSAADHEIDVWIDYNQAFCKCRQAIDLLISHAIDVELYNFPLCTVDKAYWGLYRKSITDYKVNYYPECSVCMEKENCGGVFAGSRRLVGEVHPFNSYD